MPERHVIERGVLLVGEDVSRLTEISRQFDPTTYATTISETGQSLRYLLQPHSTEPGAIILALNGRENVADLSDLFERYPETVFLFLAPDFPPRAAIARVVARNAAAILRLSESPAVIAATLIALQFQKRTPGSHHV
jgi:hypothetical protein